MIFTLIARWGPGCSQCHSQSGRYYRNVGPVAWRGLLLFFAVWMACFSPDRISGQNTVTVTIDARAARIAVSPWIYGRNNALYDGFNSQVSTATWTKYRDSGLRMFREGGGNNSTKYNWRKKLSSHPDWYNNVYSHDWDVSARSLVQKLPGSQGMFTFPLIGKVAGNKNNNFNDWAYNSSQWWEGCAQNLAGGGIVDPSGTHDALKEGNPDLYLVSWPPDSAVGILRHWFGQGGIGLDSNSFRYWSMDNEPEIWEGTHDDVMSDQISAGEFMERYFETAKKARTLYPGIKITGPVPANEWQWYNWKGGAIAYQGKNYVWLEYFIKRVADEQKATGIRLLDLLDIHFYPHETASAEILQTHRIFFDKTYVYPGHNGVHRIGGGWTPSIHMEYIFERCREWLVKYMGQDHGVTFGLTESSVNVDTPVMVKTIWYASMLGEFARQGVEVFTPWDWRPGMYEVIHLFTRYGHDWALPATSSQEEFVSAYPSVNSTSDSVSVHFINRSLDQTKTVTLLLRNFTCSSATLDFRQLKNLTGETFVSRQQNALTSGSVTARGDTVSLMLPPLSVTCLLVPGILTGIPGVPANPSGTNTLSLFPNPAHDQITVSWPPCIGDKGILEVYSASGQWLKSFPLSLAELSAGVRKLNVAGWTEGICILRLSTSDRLLTGRLTVVRQP